MSAEALSLFPEPDNPLEAVDPSELAGMPLSEAEIALNDRWSDLNRSASLRALPIFNEPQAEGNGIFFSN